jgi:Na+/melibiose symporter-like transporter
LIGAGGVWLLVLAVVNSLPVAMTSPLFLFFVEDSLQLTDWSGPFLIFFFVASGIAIPVWSKLAERFGARPVLLAAMCLSISSFVWAAMIQPGNALGFGIICFASGAAVGAELVILPAVFASLLSRAGVAPAQSFGLWSFATKLSLPIAAAATLPLLDQAGFVAGQVNSEAALDRLTLLYAVVPCALKIIACITLLSLPKRIFAGAATL